MDYLGVSRGLCYIQICPVSGFSFCNIIDAIVRMSGAGAGRRLANSRSDTVVRSQLVPVLRHQNCLFEPSRQTFSPCCQLFETWNRRAVLGLNWSSWTNRTCLLNTMIGGRLRILAEITPGTVNEISEFYVIHVSPSKWASACKCMFVWCMYVGLYMYACRPTYICTCLYVWFRVYIMYVCMHVCKFGYVCM
jgi:hypothetical protein